jgi:hypothetical protein
MEVKANDTLPFLEVLIMKRDPKLATEVYRKPTHTGRYLHFKINHPHHVKSGVVHSLISQAEVVWQDQKDFSNKIENIRHNLILNKYPQVFVDAVIKPLKSNHPSSDTIYQDTIITPYVTGISEKSRYTGNHFNVRNFFKTNIHFVGH